MYKRGILLCVVLTIAAICFTACSKAPSEPATFNFADPAMMNDGTQTELPSNNNESPETTEPEDTTDVQPTAYAQVEELDPDVTPPPPAEEIESGDIYSGETGNQSTPEPETESNEDPIPYKRFADTRLGIASHAPAEWKKTDGETSVTFTMEMPTFAPRVMVMVAKLNENETGKALAELTSRASANLNNKYAGFQLSGETVGVLLDQESLEYSFSGTYNNNVSMKGRLAFTSKDGKLYIIQYVTAAADFETYENVFRRVREKLVIE